jgi:hypothetical protein
MHSPDVYKPFDKALEDQVKIRADLFLKNQSSVWGKYLIGASWPNGSDVGRTLNQRVMGSNPGEGTAWYL